MQVEELNFQFPEELIATTPSRPSRVMWVDGMNSPLEISISELKLKFQKGDVLVVNDTKVVKRRVFIDDLEILFLKEVEPRLWQVLFPSKKIKIGDEIRIPEGRKLTLLQKGRPQVVQVDGELGEDYFERNAELPLPPYIQKARGFRHNEILDQNWYQTAWAEKAGSLAAPTASLHFSQSDLLELKYRGVEILSITLHVGLGTFLPVTATKLDDHVMHAEWIEIPAKVRERLEQAKKEKVAIWALGTTVARSVESWAAGLITLQKDGSVSGLSTLFIRPGFEFKILNRLLTNFHQPQSTLLALVAAFSSLGHVKACYEWAIQHRFRLFSYGDLTVWIKK